MVQVPGLVTVLCGRNDHSKLTRPGEQLSRGARTRADVGALGVSAGVVTVAVVDVAFVDVWGVEGE